MSGQLILSATLSTRSKRLDLGGRTSVCTLFPYCKFCCPGGPKLESLHAQSHISTGDSVRCSCKHFNKWSGICAAVLQRGATKSWPRRQRFRISGIPKHKSFSPFFSVRSRRLPAGTCLQCSYKQRFASVDGKTSKRTLQLSHLLNQLWSGPAMRLFVERGDL